MQQNSINEKFDEYVELLKQQDSIISSLKELFKRYERNHEKIYQISQHIQPIINKEISFSPEQANKIGRGHLTDISWIDEAAFIDHDQREEPAFSQHTFVSESDCHINISDPDNSI